MSHPAGRRTEVSAPHVAHLPAPEVPAAEVAPSKMTSAKMASPEVPSAKMHPPAEVHPAAAETVCQCIDRPERGEQQNGDRPSTQRSQTTLHRCTLPFLVKDCGLPADYSAPQPSSGEYSCCLPICNPEAVCDSRWAAAAGKSGSGCQISSAPTG